jgi:hypothetical protein
MIGDDLKPLFVVSSNRARRPDPPRKGEIAKQIATANQPPAKDRIVAKLAEMASRMAELEELVTAATPALPPIPPTAPPRPVEPAPREIQIDDRGRAYVPTNLTAAELAATAPSAETIRRWKIGAEQREAQQNEPPKTPHRQQWHGAVFRGTDRKGWK